MVKRSFVQSPNSDPACDLGECVDYAINRHKVSVNLLLLHHLLIFHLSGVNGLLFLQNSFLMTRFTLLFNQICSSFTYHLSLLQSTCLRVSKLTSLPPTPLPLPGRTGPLDVPVYAITTTFRASKFTVQMSLLKAYQPPKWTRVHR